MSNKIATDTVTALRSRLYKNYRSNKSRLLPADDRLSRAPYIRQLILKHFPQNRDAKILDVGCGNGTLIHFLREGGYQDVSGIDTSLEQVAAAERLQIDGVRHGNVADIVGKLKAEAFNVVVAFDVIEHMTKPELLEFSDHVYRVLKPGGRWIIHAPNAEAPFGARVRYADWTHEQAFTRESLEELLRLVGFEQIECYEDQPIIHGVKSFLRWIAWKLSRAILRIYWLAETGSGGRNCIFSQNLLAVAIK